MMLYLDTLNENEFSTRIETRVGAAGVTRAQITRKGHLVRTYTVKDLSSSETYRTQKPVKRHTSKNCAKSPSAKGANQKVKRELARQKMHRQKGSYRVFKHPKLAEHVSLSGADGDDAKK